jgi:hypothetical protein
VASISFIETLEYVANVAHGNHNEPIAAAPPTMASKPAIEAEPAGREAA